MANLFSSVAVHGRMLVSLELIINGRLVLSHNSSIFSTLLNYVLKYRKDSLETLLERGLHCMFNYEVLTTQESTSP